MQFGKTSNQIVRASSITHQHIAAVINTLLERSSSTGPRNLRILDMGCGDGRLMSYLLNAVPVLQPDVNVDVFGFDVFDAEQQLIGYWVETKDHLRSQHPNIDWNKNLSQISIYDNWPYANQSFDFIVSNQVMEHIREHEFVFNEIRRCLVPHGTCISLFPTKEVLWERHALMPLVHRINDLKKREAFILFLARLGFRSHFNRGLECREWQSLEEYAHVWARVLETDTNYLTVRQLARIAKQSDLNVSFTYSKNLFSAKALSLLNKNSYKYSDRGQVESLALMFCKRLSSITMLLNKIEK